MQDTSTAMSIETMTKFDAPKCNFAEYHDTIFGVELAVPLVEAILTVIVLGSAIIVTVVGNVLVILSVFKHRPLRIAQNFFIVSLAVADLMVAVLVLPLNVIYYLLGKWVFNIYICKIWLTSDVLCCTASILNLCVIALDRYWAITDPIAYASKRTMERVNYMIAFAWIVSAIISSPPLLGWNDWPIVFRADTPCKLTSEKGYVIYSSSGSFFIPLLIMSIVYLQIFIATRRRLRERANFSKMRMVGKEQRVNPAATVVTVEGVNLCAQRSDATPSPRRTPFKFFKRNEVENTEVLTVALGEPARDESFVSDASPGKNTSSEGNELPRDLEAIELGQPAITCESSVDTNTNAIDRQPVFMRQYIEEKQKISLSKERKAARTLGIIMGVFVFCWMPFFMMYVIEPFCPSCCISTRTRNIITWLGYINSALNPIIYTIFNMDFRIAFKKILKMNP